MTGIIRRAKEERRPLLASLRRRARIGASLTTYIAKRSSVLTAHNSPLKQTLRGRLSEDRMRMDKPLLQSRAINRLLSHRICYRLRLRTRDTRPQTQWIAEIKWYWGRFSRPIHRVLSKLRSISLKTTPTWVIKEEIQPCAPTPPRCPRRTVKRWTTQWDAWFRQQEMTSLAHAIPKSIATLVATEMTLMVQESAQQVLETQTRAEFTSSSLARSYPIQMNNRYKRKSLNPRKKRARRSAMLSIQSHQRNLC